MIFSGSILLLSDNNESTIAADLDILYPDKVTKINFTKHSHKPVFLKNFTHIVTLVFDCDSIKYLDYDSIIEYAKEGGQVISCLYEYSVSRQLNFEKSYIYGSAHPGIRIDEVNDITKGFSVGDILGWFGMVSDAPDQRYANQLFQRQVSNIKPSDKTQIIASSTINGNAVIVEEHVGKGRIVAMDLISPLRPFHNSWGSTNKYLFLGNIINSSVRYGKHYGKRLGYDKFVELLHNTTDLYSDISIQNEGNCSDGRPLYSLNIGDPDKPAMFFGASIHGWEWENAYGLLRLAEVLCQNPAVENLPTRGLSYKIIPIQNPYGFDNFTRHNANGVDLNRNFACEWNRFDYAQDRKTPWDYNYKGSAASSEPETTIIQNILGDLKPICVIDFHTADYIMVPAHTGDPSLIESIHDDIKCRLRDRYISQKPMGGRFQQVNLCRRKDFGRPLPYCISYAAEQGTPAAFIIEMSGDRDDVHALVMNTDTVVEICLAAIKQCILYV